MSDGRGLGRVKFTLMNRKTRNQVTSQNVNPTRTTEQLADELRRLVGSMETVVFLNGKVKVIERISIHKCSYRE